MKRQLPFAWGFIDWHSFEYLEDCAGGGVGNEDEDVNVDDASRAHALGCEWHPLGRAPAPRFRDVLGVGHRLCEGAQYPRDARAYRAPW